MRGAANLSEKEMRDAKIFLAEFSLVSAIPKRS